MIFQILHINSFLDYYLSKNLNLSFRLEVSNSLNNYFQNRSKKPRKNIQFDDFITQSNFQNLLLFDINKDYLFLNSCASFFETSGKYYFIYPNITFAIFT